MADGTNAPIFRNNTPLLAFAGDMGGAGQNGDWVNCANVHYINFLLYSPAAGAGDALTIFIDQAKDNVGTDAKGVEFDLIGVQAATTLDAGPGRGYHQELPARVDNVNVVGLETQDAANLREAVTVTGAMESVVTIAIPVTRLDTSEDFSHVRIRVVSAAARVGMAFTIIEDAYDGSQIYNNPLA